MEIYFLTMTILTNFTFDINLVSCGILGGSTIFIVGSIIKNIWFTEDSSSINTIEPGLETPTTDTGIDTIRALSTNNPSPTIFRFQPDQLREIQSITDQLTHIDSSSTVNLHTSSRIIESWNNGVHTIVYPNSNVRVIENNINLIDLYNSGRLDQLSNTVWATTNNTSSIFTNSSPLLTNITEGVVNNAHVLTSNAELLGCAFPYF